MYTFAKIVQNILWCRIAALAWSTTLILPKPKQQQSFLKHAILASKYLLYIILNQENSKSPQKTKFKVLFKKKLLVPHFTPLRTQENTFLFHFYWMKLFMKPWWSFTSSGVSRFGASEITCQKCLTTTHFPIKIELAFFAFGSVVSFFRVKPPVIVEWQQLKPIMPVINVIENEPP